jgi:hypothetical protein
MSGRAWQVTGLDLVRLSDHPYFAERTDAYAARCVYTCCQ